MRVIVTGAGSGVGRATSALLAARGHEVDRHRPRHRHAWTTSRSPPGCASMSRDPASVDEVKR